MKFKSVSASYFIIVILFFSTSVQGQTPLTDKLFHADSIKSIVSFLASDKMKGRLTGSKEMEKSSNYIADEFRKAPVLPVMGNDGYFSRFTFEFIKGESIQGINVIAAIPGRSKADEIVIFCSHYDHIGSLTNKQIAYGMGNKFDKKDKIYNGANDNASGTSAVILLARYFAEADINERTILFITFAGEEFGLRGSSAFANSINPEKVKAVVNIEMIGRGLYDDQHNPYITGDSLSDFRDLLNDRLQNQLTDSSVKRIVFGNDLFVNDNLFTRSDNYPFALVGIPAHTIMLSMPSDPFYHSLDDEIDTLNFEDMSLIIKSIALSTAGLVSGIDTPTRINPRKLLH